MGFKDGIQQPKKSEWDNYVWVGEEGPAWMRGGSYLVTRRIRIALEHWDGTDVEFQEQVIGRKKVSARLSVNGMRKKRRTSMWLIRKEIS